MGDNLFMMNVLFTTAEIITVIGIILGAFVKVYKLLDKHLTEHSNSHKRLENANLYMLQEKLKNLCEHHLLEGELTIEEMEIISNLHIAYKELGGNSFITGLVDRVKDLKIERK